MSYKVVLTDPVRRDLAAWKLPDVVLVEVYLRLREGLAQAPAEQLVRASDPFDGMVFPFSMIDPTNRMSVFYLFFHVVYGQDEQTIYVLRGAKFHSFGA